MKFKKKKKIYLDPKHTFATSDHHFGSASNSSFFKVLSKAEEDKAISIWNSIIKPSDTVIYVGDFCDSSVLEAFKISKCLNGKKILVLGNHDTFPLEIYLDMFADCLEEELEDLSTGIVFRHCPNLACKEKQIYGHFHRKNVGWPFVKNGCCVCATRNNLMPLRLSECEFSI